MQDLYKFFTRLGVTRRPCFPTNVRTLQLSYDLSEDDRTFAFEETLEGTLLFGNENGDFDYLHGIETSANKCRTITLEIEKRQCDGTYQVWKKFGLRPVDGTWNLDNCTVETKTEPINEYTCYRDNKDKEVNLISLPINKAVVHHIRGTLEFLNYTSTAGYTIDNPAQFGGVAPYTLKWKCYKAEYFSNVVPHENKFYYAREVLVLPVGQNPGIEWTVIQNLGANDKWARFPLLADYTKLYVNNEVPAAGNAPIRYFGGELFAYNVVGDVLPGYFDNGMPLKDLLTYFVSNYCGLTVVSNFLQINPTEAFNLTYTFLDGLTFHHTVFQKSDVKRPNVSGNATKAVSTFRKILLAVCNMHNLWWRIESGEFRIEHVSWFQRNPTLDTTVGDAKRRLVRTRTYTYQTEKLPRYETFKFMEDGSTDFAGLPIEYVGDCVTDNENSNRKETNVDYVQTDLELCLFNSSDSSTKVSDDGLFIMAAKYDPVDDKYYTLAVNPVLDQEYHFNNSLGWAYLHDQYYRHERLQLNGYLNGDYVHFLTTRPNKKRVRVGIRFCCSDGIDLLGNVNTNLGQALIGQASHLLYQEELELDLVYRDTIGNTACLKPKKFQLSDYDPGTDAFYFETQFAVPGPFHTQIQAIKPDGSVADFFYSADVDGIFPAQFLPHIPGVYRFRKRVVCDIDFAGPWTDYISSEILVPVTCPVIPEPVTFLFRGNKPSYFIFRIAESLITPAKKVQVEVTRPGPGSPYLVSYNVETYGPGTHDVTVDINSAVPYSLSAPVPAGLYRFRFRRVCNAASGNYTAWSNYVDVNI